MLAFGLTQYNLGAVVFTLNASGESVVFDNVKYSVVGFVKSPTVQNVSTILNYSTVYRFFKNSCLPSIHRLNDSVADLSQFVNTYP